jgi:hypothetical protein
MNSVNVVTSQVASLTVYVPPAITEQPQSQTVFAGTNVTFSVTATGRPAPDYQWFFNGTLLSGVTTPTLTLTNVQLADAGSYQVVVTNTVRAVTSAVATLTVSLPSPHLLNPAWQPTTFAVSLATLNGGRYCLEYKDTLVASNWTALPAVTGDGTVLTLRDNAATGPHRLYRVRAE